MKEQELKVLIKRSVGLERKPRNLNVFYYFLYVFRQQSEDPFVSTKILQQRLGLRGHHYQKYFDAWIQSFYGNAVSNKQCRYVVWSHNFLNLMNQTQAITIPYSFIKDVCYKTSTINDKQLELLRTIYNNIHNTNNNTISSTLTDYYHSTQTSSFRLYHPLQTLKKDQKAQAFKGMYDVDLDSCFSSICYYDLNIKDERLNPACKDHFRSWVAKQLDVDTKEAKAVISRLFTGKHTKYNKLPWFNDLFNKINRAVWKEIKTLKQQYPELQWSHHQYFTYKEQCIINKVLPDCNLVLRMHDGFITSSLPPMQELNKKAYPHRFHYKKFA